MKPSYSYILLLVLILPLATGLPGCKKDSNTPSRDYTELFKNTVWIGEYQDSAGRSKPYSMEFVIGNAFIFHDQNGDFVGSYLLDKNNITFTIPGLSAKLAATVTDENTFTEWKKTGSQSWTILNGAFNVLVDQQLENTSWGGKGSDGRAVDFTFKPGGEIVIESELRIMTAKYTRRAGAIRCSFYGNDKFFLVLQTNNKLIKGAWFTDITFDVTQRK